MDNDQELLSDFEEEEEKIADELDDDLIDDSSHPEDGMSFYRELTNNNAKFSNQTRNSHDPNFECDYSLYERQDVQLELYDLVGRHLVILDQFVGFKKSVENFKNTLKNFGDSENQLFDAVIYHVMFYKSNGQIADQSRIIEVFGQDFYNVLFDIKDKIKLDRTLFGYDARCFILCKVLAKHNFFIKFFERRHKVRFLIKKKVIGKNEVTRNLSSSVLEKFNGYETIKQKFIYKEKFDFTPFDIVYEPTRDQNIPIPCFFTSQIYLACRRYFGHFKNG